jgi:hypothetical protein
MKKTVIVTLLFIGMISMSFVITADEPIYKNLKVLPRNINKQQMDSVMKHFTVSLNVKCNFCHTYSQELKAMDFASDANKHKGITREMMKMTAAINEKYFDVKDKTKLNTYQEVTCYTCHNGKAHPAKFPPPSKPQADTTKRS